MKVLYFVGTLNAGGLERFVTRVSLEARKTKTFEPIICCLTKREGLFLNELDKAEIPVYEAPQNWTRNIRQAIFFNKVIREIHPDVIHSMVNFSLFQQSLIALYQTNARFYITERNCYNLTGWNRVKRLIQFHWLRLLGVKYSANGVKVAEHLARLVGVNPRNIMVIPNGINSIPSNDPIRQNIRRQLKVSSYELLIGCVARFAEQKGHLLLLEVIYKLISDGFTVKLILIGDGPLKDEIINKIGELNISNNVILIGIVKNPEEYLLAMDIFTLFSEREGMPNAILEAMAAGKPVVATRAGAIPELIEDHETGILLTDTRPDYVAGKLKELINNPTLRVKLGDNAREFIKHNYSLEQVMKNLADLYKL